MFFTLSVIIFSTYFFIAKQRYRWFYIIYKTFRRDLRGAIRFIIVNYYLRKYHNENLTLAKVFTTIAKKNPDKVAFYFEEQKWTFQQVENYSNKIANYFKKEGLTRGDIVSLFLDNKPEYVCIWLGLCKIGVITALINSNLVNDPLYHTISASTSSWIIYGGSLKEAIDNIYSKIPSLKFYQISEDGKTEEVLKYAKHLSEEMEEQSPKSPVEDIEEGGAKDKLLFIYTSGTTGLPKAAVITNMRFMFMVFGLYYMTNIKEDDIVYNSLPLYHSSGGVIGVGLALARGVTVVIRRKFSASNFWKDCAKYKCTVAQYIGEICRYILMAHEKDEQPIQHCVRQISGNGLKPQIWEKFVKKFNIKKVFEFYGSTEGNSNLVNLDSKVGSVGFIPRYATAVYPLALVKCNESTGEAIRNSNGFCQLCKPGEVGVLLGVVNSKKTINEFIGYADKKATSKKLISNVFKTNDLYFNSGDVLIQDEFGYFYFKDRTGDTFRWKGENVATSEIEAVISNVINLNDAVVYGVEIPGTEGRAGMVAIVNKDGTLNMEKLCKGLKSNVPSYAVPIFVRVMESVPMTGTFKLKKNDLQKEAFNKNLITDKLYILEGNNYIELTNESYNDIINGKMRL